MSARMLHFYFCGAEAAHCCLAIIHLYRYKSEEAHEDFLKMDIILFFSFSFSFFFFFTDMFGL